MTQPPFIKHTHPLSLATTFAYLGFTVQYSDSGSQLTTDKALILTQNMFTSKLALSLATNIVVTLLIAYKLWFVHTIPTVNSV